GGHIRTVATDGHRLAMCRFSLEEESELRQVIVPRKGVQEIQRLLNELSGEVNISISLNHICAESEEFVLTSKLVDGRFPDYDRVIPKNGDKLVLIDRLEFKQALNRIAILSNEKFRGIRANFSSGQLTLSANNPEQEEAEETIVVDYEGQNIEIGFNVVYLQDVLSVIEGDKVRIVLHDGNSSVLLEEPEEDNSVYVVMPMKL
ncbi:MAG: DNA polymerase III subunit beta, partial [Pseudomonadales bacterium]|nr:DNA polymerase III subunit beta [Pseudomonadales bacterium]